MKLFLLELVFFSALNSSADCLSLAGKYTCATKPQEVIYIRSAIV